VPRTRPEVEEKAKELMRHIEALADRIFLEQSTMEVGRRESIVLRLLADGPLAMGELSSRISLALSTLTGIVDRLVEREYVARDRAENDRRVIIVQLTPRGREAHEQVQNSRNEFGKVLLSALDESERETMLSMFRKITRSQDE
jgi:MarR family transcriptional regulator, organic hydroperoxide resistance regulator